MVVKPEKNIEEEARESSSSESDDYNVWSELSDVPFADQVRQEERAKAFREEN